MAHDGQQPAEPDSDFVLTFDGATLTGTWALRSARALDRFMRVLNAQKAVLAAVAPISTSGEMHHA